MLVCTLVLTDPTSRVGPTALVSAREPSSFLTNTDPSVWISVSDPQTHTERAKQHIQGYLRAKTKEKRQRPPLSNRLKLKYCGTLDPLGRKAGTVTETVKFTLQPSGEKNVLRERIPLTASWHGHMHYRRTWTGLRAAKPRPDSLLHELRGQIRASW